jgi:hypothetical protein
VAGSTLYEGSVGNFYSPFETPENSDGEEEVGRCTTLHFSALLKYSELHCTALAAAE